MSTRYVPATFNFWEKKAPQARTSYLIKLGRSLIRWAREPGSCGDARVLLGWDVDMFWGLMAT